jgi:hypothetical protein
MAENHPPNKLLGSQLFQVWTGTWASFVIPSVDLLYGFSFIINLQAAVAQIKTPPSKTGE